MDASLGSSVCLCFLLMLALPEEPGGSTELFITCYLPGKCFLTQGAPKTGEGGRWHHPLPISEAQGPPRT